MNDKTDISGLFKRFGGDPSTYRQLPDDRDAKAAAARWPLLSSTSVTPARSKILNGRDATPRAETTLARLAVVARPASMPPAAPLPEPISASASNASPLQAFRTAPVPESANNLSALFQRLNQPAQPPAVEPMPLQKLCFS